MRYCTCLDLSAGEDKWFSGPQCAFEAGVKDKTAAASKPTPEPVATVETQTEPKALSQTTNMSMAQTTLQANASKLDDDGSCEGGCNGNGICKGGTCYCNKSYTGDKCNEDIAHPGVKAPMTFIFYGSALFLGLVTGGFVAKIYNENNKKLFL